MRNNKIVHQVTREYMKKNKKRTITTLFGIVFMVMLMTCVFVGKDTAVHYLEELASLEKGSWHINVYDVTDAECEQLKDMDDVEQMGISANLGYAMFPQSGYEYRPYIYVKSYNEDAFELHNITVVEGRLPENENEIVLNVEAKEDGADIRVGDTIEAELFERYIAKDADHELTTMFAGGFEIMPGQRLEAPVGFPYFGENDDFYEDPEFTGVTAIYTVVGFMEKPFYEKTEAAGYTAICYNDGAQIPGSETNVSIRFELKRNGDYDTAVENIVGEDCEIEYNSMLLAFSANSKDSTINGIVNFMSVFFVVLIIAASVVLIYNVFNISFEERTKYLGMLSSVGATGKQKRSSVYYEAYFLLVVGLPVGFAVGLLVVKLGMKALQPHLDTLLGLYARVSMDKVPLEISFAGVALIMVLSVVTVWISAYLPARKIGKIGPIECIRGNASRGNKKHATNKLGVRFLGAEYLLATNFVSREKKKTRGLVGAAAVFMIVLIITSYASKALTTIVNYALADDSVVRLEMDADFMISSSSQDYGVKYEELKSRVQTDESVEAYFEFYDGMFLGWGDKSILSQEYLDTYKQVMAAYGFSTEAQNGYVENLETRVNFIGLDDATLAEIVEATGTDESIMNDKNVMPAIIVQTGELSTDNIRFYEAGEADFKFYEVDKVSDVPIGETMDISVLNGEKGEYESVPVTVAGYATNDQISEYISVHSEMIWVITNMETVQQLLDMEMSGDENNFYYSPKILYVKFSDSSSQLYSDLNTMHFETVNQDNWEGLVVISSSLYNTATIADAINAVIEILLICFVVLTSVICMLNLYNSTKGRITGRRKEFAILRSMGMTEKQMRKMLIFEAGSVLIRSVLIAVLVATPVLYMMTKVLVKLFGRVSLGSPVGVYLLAIGIAAAALILITVLTHNREKSENILEDIRRESI